MLRARFHRVDDGAVIKVDAHKAEEDNETNGKRETRDARNGRAACVRSKRTGRRRLHTHSAGTRTVAHLVEDGVTVDVGLRVRVEEAVELHRGAACVKVDEHLRIGAARTHTGSTSLACV